MFLDVIAKLLGSSIFTNILLLATLLAALTVGYRQISLNDVVELYATPSTKEAFDQNGNSLSVNPIINIQNTGTRLVYMEKYVFNGSEYLTHGQVLPPAYSQSKALYWIDLPDTKSGVKHVSLTIYYRDLDSRYWKSEITADFVNSTWKVSSLPRKSNKR